MLVSLRYTPDDEGPRISVVILSSKSTILSSNMPIDLLSKLRVTQNLFICPWRYYALSLLLFVVKNAFTHDFDNEGFLFQLQVCKIVEGQ